MDRRDFFQSISGATATACLPIDELSARVKTAMQKNNIAPAQYDVIVLGVGSMGSATCYFLAQQGYKVLGLEQFDIPHELGSHGGQSRIIRKAYAEHPDYVPLLERAYQNWRALEAATGEQVYYKTGLLYGGRSNDKFITGVKRSSGLYNIPVEELSEEEGKKRFPSFHLPAGYQQLFEPDAGFLTPEKSILLFTEQAIRKGAVIRTREKVQLWKRENKLITVTTNQGSYQAKKLVITAGPWAGKMIPTLTKRLTVTRQAIAWMQPKKWEEFTLGNFPCWLIENEGHEYYGFPILPVGQFGGPAGLKLAMHFPGGEITDPDRVNRQKKEEDEQVLVAALRRLIPGAYETTLTMKTCLYTNSPDHHFILDHLPGFERDVVIAAGFSGHGFKFVSAIGEILADLAIKGRSGLPIGFLGLNRFT